MSTIYVLIDTDSDEVVGYAESLPDVLSMTTYDPADLVEEAETWEQVAAYYAQGQVEVPGYSVVRH